MKPENNEAEMLETSRLRESSAVGASPIVPQSAVDAHQGDALFPSEPATPIARPLVLVTRGRIEYLGRCPHCQNMHRHTHLGKVTGPCGREYELQPKATRRAA
ncbi:hypothetical protein ACG2OD_32210 [Streptomyces sp. PDY-4]|uniref:Uncharacterized protein n=1 Tax=Streptomyces fungicidicus TaxID=68203 RepID=A0A494UMT5_9ACTN|nr:hypothetical protein [Streptomyces fungicidicus]AYL34825.1 hypothetical protein CNQ36_04935 [Streptomyces fungicidicus]